MFWLDTALLAALSLGAILGARSGLVWQLARLLGLALALWLAVRLNEAASAAVQSMLLQDADPRLIRLLAYAVVFVVVYLVLYVLTSVVYEAIESTPLEPFDRVLGAALGAGKVALLLAVLCWAVISVQHPKAQEIVDRSVLAPALADGLETALLFLPPDWKTDVQTSLESARNLAADGR